jgi:hypothetical protein
VSDGHSLVVGGDGSGSVERSRIVLRESLLKVSDGHSLVLGGDGGGGSERSRIVLCESLLKVSDSHSLVLGGDVGGGSERSRLVLGGGSDGVCKRSRLVLGGGGSGGDKRARLVLCSGGAQRSLEPLGRLSVVTRRSVERKIPRLIRLSGKLCSLSLELGGEVRGGLCLEPAALPLESAFFSRGGVTLQLCRERLQRDILVLSQLRR